MIDKRYLDRIKKFEGYYAKPYWDYRQWTSGYGTRAAGPHETIDQAEAERRLQAEIANVVQMVDAFAPGLEDGKRAALTSLTYNAGSGWMKSGLGEAIKRGDWDDAKRRFSQYVNAGGKPLAGLRSRRLEELRWMDEGAGEPRDALPFSIALSDPTSQTDAAVATLSSQQSDEQAPFGLTFQADSDATDDQAPQLPRAVSPLRRLKPRRVDMSAIIALANAPVKLRG